MVMTHHTEVADRIDRSNSPRGGGEERELYDWFKERLCSLTPCETFYCRSYNHDAIFRMK